jgi:hypothetical protein
VHLEGVKEMKQEWQYLTDDEIKEIVGSYASGLGPYVRDLFNKIEAKIREKNETKRTVGTR